MNSETNLWNNSVTFTWSRYGGYECSTRGDKRFSAFCALLSDGRSIEAHYQCDVKGYQPGGDNWRLGKGKPSLNKSKDLWLEYLKLWIEWAKMNPDLIDILHEKSKDFNYTLSDCFASGQINQARALSVILNKLFGESK